MKTKIFLIVFFIGCILGFSQKKSVVKNLSVEKNGYKITINTENLKGETLVLSFFKGNAKSFKKNDSAKITENHQIVVFKLTKAIISFPVRLSFAKQKENYISLFVTNGIDVKANLSSNDITTLSTENALNKDFIKYQNENSANIKSEMASQMMAKYKNEDLNLFFALESKKTLKPEQNLKEFSKNMLDGIDLTKKSVVLMPNIYAYINNYFVNSKDYNESLKTFFGKMDCNSNNFSFYLDWLMKNLLYKEKAGELVKDHYIFLVTQFFSEQNCQEKFSNQYKQLLNKIATVDVLKVGDKIPDFKMFDAENKTHHISDVAGNGNVTVIVFFDPDCSHCIEDMPKIVSEINTIEKETSQKINKIGFLYFGEPSKWKDFIEKNKMEHWLNVNSPTDREFSQKLGIEGLPTTYIIDKKGNLVSKYFNPEILKNEVYKSILLK